MLRKFAQGNIKKQILPGTDTQNTLPKSNFSSYLQQTEQDNFENDCRNYVNLGLNKYDTEDNEYDQVSKTVPYSSNMSSVDSISNIGSIMDLKDLDIDEIMLFENYKFKDPADKSNNLPIAQSKEKIIQAIHSNCIVLITGVTGCGKSTQVPQYILDDCMIKKKNCNIIVTQPRRIAAISVSKQVNKERGWKNGLLVGYQVGRKRDFDPKNTKILFCTTGVLLQKIIKAKNLSEFTHIILDEVHERTLEMDFLLLIIKKLIKTNSQSTRIILMSATANSFKLQEYFNDYYGLPYNRHEGAQLISVDANCNFPVTKHYLDSLYGVIPCARKMEFNKPRIDEAGYETAIQLVIAFDGMESQGVIKKNSSVLIFLPGIFEIEEMHRLMENEMTIKNHKWILLPLHSSITSDEQDRVFDQPLQNHRKIILSTNIAESSITVSDISYVIDFCLMKQLKNEMKSNYSMLVMTWASKSNCEQRAGRVGRVSVGRVYRLVPELMYKREFSDHETPEMNRCSLSRIVLMSKILGMGTPLELLGSALDPPSCNNIALTILTLKQVGALLPTVSGVITPMDGDITFLGKVMAQLPLDPPMSKLIYFGYIFNILNEAIIMACGLSLKSIFSQPFNKRLDAYAQKLSWANNSCSDPIAYINPYQSWLEKKPEFDRNRFLEKSWANNNYIQLSAIRELYDLVNDVTDRLRKSFGIVINSGKMKWTEPEEKAMACKIILAGAFYPNYFIRGTSNEYMDEHHVLKLLEEHDPNQTVYFTGFPNDQPKNLYKEAIENLFPKKFVGKSTAFFSTSNKVYVEFPTSNTNNIVLSNNHKNDGQLIPGNICFGVYVALKMNQLRYNFNIPLLKPEDAKIKMELSKQNAPPKILLHNILPVQKNVLDEIEPYTKDIIISITYFESVSCFWAQLFDEFNKNKLLKVWNINEIKNLPYANPNSIKAGGVYIVIFKEEKYRATLISNHRQQKKKYKFFLIDFGQVVELCIEQVFDISTLNEDMKNEIFSVPALAFKCTISKIQPTLLENLERNWSDEANFLIRDNGSFPNILYGTIYSIVNGVLSFEDLKFIENNKTISIPEYLIEKKLANRAHESFASKIDHEKRSKIFKATSSETYQKSNDLFLNLKSPTEEEAYEMHYLKGPNSPLEMSIQGINKNSVVKIVKIESQSVNSVLLDTCPNDYHQRLFVAGNVCLNENDQKLTLWDTTMMPNIPGMPAIVCLLFSPCVEIRYNSSFTKIIGAICGLGYDPKTSMSLFPENDIEITFDTVVDNDFLINVNIIRMLLNKCVNPEDDEGPGDIFEIAYNLQKELIKLFSSPTIFKSPEPFSDKYKWGCILKSKLRSPYPEGTPIIHPMAGSDIYKLIWKVNLLPKLSESECKDLINKLSKIRRLKDGFKCNYYSYGLPSEDLYCPLCHLVFSNNASMEMHFNNYQHIERYQLTRNELHVSYEGPFSDIQNL